MSCRVLAATEHVVAVGCTGNGCIGSHIEGKVRTPSHWNASANLFGALATFDARTGKALWSLNDIAVDEIAVSGDTLIARGAYPDPFRQGYFAFDASDGRQLWEAPLAYVEVRTDDDLMAPALAYDPESGGVVVGDHHVWLAGAEVQCRALRTGERVWSQPSVGKTNSLLWLSGRLWALGDGQLFALDPETGTVAGPWVVPNGVLLWADDHRIAIGDREWLHIVHDERAVS
jgi:outer membrane protein assembly factor BamB